MDLQLGDKTCLVTGASSGIGRATALALAREGAHLVVAARSDERLRSLAEEIRTLSGREAVLATADLSTAAGPRALADEALARVSRIDVLINNAGASRPVGPDAPDADWADAHQLGYTAIRQLVESLAPGMLERRWGRVVNVTGAIVGKSLNASAPAKAALESWSKAIAAAYAPHGVTVNCVAPGRIASDQILNRLHPTEASRRDFIERNIPAGRFGDPQEAAALIVFLASGPASYVTGTTVPVDGGALRFAF